MALKMAPETRTRVTTGVAGGAVFLIFLLFGGDLGITFITAVLALAMVWELSQAFLVLGDHAEKRNALMGASWLIIFVNHFAPRSLLETVVMAILLFFAYFLAVANRHASQLREHFIELSLTCFTLLYVVGFMVFLPMIRNSLNGLHWTVLFFLIVWAGDTGAYFAGRKYGGQKIYPLISPGKTVSGALGGLAASVLISIIYKLLVFKGLGIFGALLTPLVIGPVSQIGDLCESFLKRAFKIKDTSQLLPGHGGVLDRFDGILFALPVMYLCCKAFG